MAETLPALPHGAQGNLGEPIEREGVTLVPVFGRSGRVRGAYVIADGKARWEPAFDLSQAILVGNVSWWVMAFLFWRIVSRRRSPSR